MMSDQRVNAGKIFGKTLKKIFAHFWILLNQKNLLFTFSLKPLFVWRIKKWEIPFGLWLHGTRTLSAKHPGWLVDRRTMNDPKGSCGKTFMITSLDGRWTYQAASCNFFSSSADSGTRWSRLHEKKTVFRNKQWRKIHYFVFGVESAEERLKFVAFCFWQG